MSGGLIAAFDAGVRVEGALIGGRYALEIVLDCAALDAHALYLAAVVAFPAAARARVVGLLTGTAVIAVVNVLRIAALYFVGVHWPLAFSLLHEELFQIALVVLVCGLFIAWTGWARRHAPARRTDLAHAR